MNYFKDLFTEDNFDRPKLNTRYNYPQIEDEILLCFRRDIEDDEIKEAIRSMGVLKSPGPDGIGAIFYQSQWEHIGDSVTSTVKYFFNNRQAIKEINGIFIVLILKKSPPERVHGLRPISLCNVIFKAIAKVITNRTKTYGKLNWDFLFDCMDHLKFPTHIIDVITQIMPSSTMQLLQNGNKYEAFLP